MASIKFTVGSVTINGTGGAGHLDMGPQSVAPSTPPANAVRYYADNSGRSAYILSDGFTRTFAATVTANRVYTYPDDSANVVLDTTTQSLSNKTITNLSNTVAATSLFYSGGSLSFASVSAPSSGQAIIATASAGGWAIVSDNLGLAASVSANALTITLTQSNGSSAPTSSNPTTVYFRDTTNPSGAITVIAVSSTVTLTIPSGTTIGTGNSYAGYIYVYALNNAGTVVLAVSLSPLALDALVSSTAISGGSSASVLYSASAQTTLPIQYLGKILAPQVTAGTWASAPTEIYVRSQDYSAGRVTKKIGDIETINSSNVPAALSLGAAGTVVSTTNGTALAYNALTGDGTITGNGLSIPFSFVFGIFGNGKNGSATFSSNGSITTDMYYTNLTINNLVTVTAQGVRIFVSGTLTLNGTLTANGANGSAGSGTTGGGGGTSTGVTTGSSSAGGSGGGPGVSGGAGGSVNPSIGGGGGTGGSVSGSGGSGAAGTATAINITGGSFRAIFNPYNLMVGRDNNGVAFGNGASGGGGGGGTGGSGGGGGAGGGVIIVFANQLAGSGTLSANGGNGGNAGGTNGGGGGGGGYGLAALAYHSSTFSGSVGQTSGSGGTGTGTGTSGASPGGSGTQVFFQL